MSDSRVHPSSEKTGAAVLLGLTLVGFATGGLAAVSPGVAGCAPDPAEDPTPAELAVRLEWTLSEVSGGVYELTLSNPGRTPVSLSGMTVHLEARFDPAPQALPRPPDEETACPPAALPETLDAGSSTVLTFALPTGALWPTEFTVQAAVEDGRTAERVVVAEKRLRPGAIFMTPVWPENGAVDVPVRGCVFSFEFDQAVDLESLGRSLTVDPPLVVDIRASAAGPDSGSGAQGPFVVEIEPLGDLSPFTRHTITLGPELTATGGGTTMGRPRGLAFSTGGPAVPAGAMTPTWSPDDSLVAWVAPAPGGTWVLNLTHVSDAGSEAYPVGGLEPGRPAWGPDGRFIYVPLRQPEGLCLGRLDLETGEVEVLVDAARLDYPSGLTLGTSPDGRFLAAEANLGGAGAHSDIMSEVYLYNFSSGVLTHLPKEGLTARMAGWQDGCVLYAVIHQGYDHGHEFRYDLYRYDPARALSTPLVTGGLVRNPGGFSTAGPDLVLAWWTWEAHTAGLWTRHEPADVWVLEDLGSEVIPPPRKLTEGGRYRDVALGPDGACLAAAAVREATWDLVFLGLPDGTQTLLAGETAAEFGPAWSNAGSRIAFVQADGSGCRLGLVDPVTGNTVYTQTAGGP